MSKVKGGSACSGIATAPLLGADAATDCHRHAHGSGCTSHAHQPGACHGFETLKGAWLNAGHEELDIFNPQSAEARRRKKGRTALSIAAFITAVVTCLELACGYTFGSLALMSDGVHQLTDVALYLGLLFAMILSEKEGDISNFSFGYHRAQVLGTLMALLLQYFATGLLVTTAITRLLGQSKQVDGRGVCVMASISLLTNLVLLHIMPAGHGHSHGGSEATNVARLHMLGDLVQGVSVILAGVVVWIKPEYVAADSMGAFVYAGIVLATTYNVLHDLVRVLMERAPPELDTGEMFNELARIKGVIDVHCCHVWMLGPEKVAMSAHMHIEDDEGLHEDVLHTAQILLKHKYGIVHTTLQISEDEDLA